VGAAAESGENLSVKWRADDLIVRLLQRLPKQQPERQVGLEPTRRHPHQHLAAGFGETFDCHHVEPRIRVHRGSRYCQELLCRRHHRQEDEQENGCAADLHPNTPQSRRSARR
jgi:hypothetical protein